MTGATPPPSLLLSDKLMTITNLKTLVLVLLDVDEMNYSTWMYFFKNLCRGHELLKHILGEPTDEASSTRLVVEDPQTAQEAWDLLVEIFSDNKRSCSIALKAELRSMKLGDLSIDAYFQKIESIATILTSFGSPISNDDVVIIALEGLANKYENVSSIITHYEPFSDLKTAHSMPTTEEMRARRSNVAMDKVLQPNIFGHSGHSSTPGQSGQPVQPATLGQLGSLARKELNFPNAFNAMTLQILLL
ncbi:hybrid signal transduction histidine kinase M, partial [Tanacetum coccineum]